MLYILGKVESNNTVIGYRVLDLTLKRQVPKPANALINATIKTLDKYQLLQILYSKDGDKPFRLVNAKLGYKPTPNSTYFLNIVQNSKTWSWLWVAKTADGAQDVKNIPNYTTLDWNKLVVESSDGSLDSYGTYGEKDPAIVILAEYQSRTGEVLGYLVGDANSESTQVELLATNKLIEKVMVRERHTGKKCLANAYLRESNGKRIIAAKHKYSESESFYTVRLSDQTESMPVTTEPTSVKRPRAQGPTDKTEPELRLVAVDPAMTKIVKGQLYNNNLGILRIHAGVTEISHDALLLCQEFTAFDVEKSNPNFCSPGGLLLSKDGRTLVRCPIASGVNISSIPNYIRTIAKGAFRGCLNLTEVTIPATVERVEAGAFCGVPNLKKVICHAKYVDEEAFVDCPNLEVLIFGDGVNVITGTVVRNSPKLRYIILPDSLKAITPKEYIGMLVSRYADKAELHKMIETSAVTYIFAPRKPEVQAWVRNFYTDTAMYDAANKRFKVVATTPENLQGYKLSAYEKLIRRKG